MEGETASDRDEQVTRRAVLPRVARGRRLQGLTRIPRWKRDVTTRVSPNALVAFMPLCLLLGACRPSETSPPTGSPDGLPYAYAMNECAPWDGLATLITLSADTLRPGEPTGSEVPRPYVWISVYQPADALGGERFKIDQERIAGAMRCTVEETSCDPSTFGFVEFRMREADGSLPGLFRLGFEDGSTVEGEFRAQWYDRRIMCG